MSTSLRTLRMWLLLALALPEGGERDVLVDLAADAFLEAWRFEMRARRDQRKTSLGAVAEA